MSLIRWPDDQILTCLSTSECGPPFIFPHNLSLLRQSIARSNLTNGGLLWTLVMPNMMMPSWRRCSKRANTIKRPEVLREERAREAANEAPARDPTSEFSLPHLNNNISKAGRDGWCWGGRPKQDSKRMRTSDSPDSPTNGPVSSGDEKHGKTAAAPCSTKKSRGAAARNSTTTSSSVAGKRTSTRNRGGEKNKEVRKEGMSWYLLILLPPISLIPLQQSKNHSQMAYLTVCFVNRFWALRRIPATPF